jgi:inosine-uridine nucleoside N-ribohydrolase
MQRLVFILGWIALFPASHLLRATEPVRLILDTDIGNDVDDALALGLIHSLEDRGEVHLLAVTITKDNRYAAPYVNLVNTFYGRASIPIGVVHNGKTPADAPMLRVPAEKRDSKGRFVYPHILADGNLAPDAQDVLTQVLSDQPDGSVTLAQIGFSTNLARLIKSESGMRLVKRKVKLLSIMAGNFVEAKREYNVYTDPEAAEYLFSHWPTPIVFSGFEIGLLATFPYRSIENGFAWATTHPIVDAYKLYVGKPEDHPNWDSTAVLYAIRPDQGYFELSQMGNVSLGEKQTTVFTPDPAGKCRYLILRAEQVERVKTTIADLVTEPPRSQSAARAAAQRLAF